MQLLRRARTESRRALTASIPIAADRFSGLLSPVDERRRFIPAALLALVLVAAMAWPSPASSAPKDEALWQALAKGGGVVALMRHALAPGGGDPANFTIGNCATQRNLSEAGRNQARATGALMRKQGVAAVRLYSSQWCRCKETARLLGFGEPQELPALNSLHGRPQNRDAQVAELKRFIAALPKHAPTHILVSHHATIGALIDVYLGSGDLVVVRGDGKGGIEVLGEIEGSPAE